MSYFFFNDTATTEIYTLSLHDALPIFLAVPLCPDLGWGVAPAAGQQRGDAADRLPSTSTSKGLPMRGHRTSTDPRSEEHTSELQSRQYLVCRILLEKK